MSPTDTVEHLDVVVIGAGISGIGAGHYLRARLPELDFALLEARDVIGGTWDLFRYPGIRSDSDLFTFGYEFKPWTGASIATAEEITAYLAETVREEGLEPRIRFHHKVVGLSWSSEEARWTVAVERTDIGERLTVTAGWVFVGTGYYDYAQGHTPPFEGREDFRGAIVHPQAWPEDLDHTGARVVVIGSGATAVTLAPALAERAAHVTMLQRTPSYVLSLPSRDALAQRLIRLLGPQRGHALTRRKNIAQQRALYALCRRHPRAARRLLRRATARHLPDGYDVDTHFNPPYDPWDQLLCVVPDGDLFRAIGSGATEVVTDRVARFTERGVLLESGREVEADIIVTATGLTLLPFSGLQPVVDGESVDLTERVTYKGMMLSGVPNLVFAIGYTNSSWTLKIGLVCEHFCRIVRHLRDHGYVACAPVLGPPEAGMERRPLLDFGAGYVQRSLHLLPRQGDRPPWQMSMSYRDDVRLVEQGPVIDEHLRLARPGERLPLHAEVGSAADDGPARDRFCALPTGATLCYRTDGDPTGDPLVLVAGLGLDLTFWSPAWVDGLVQQGFWVIRPDNRDAGRSIFDGDQPRSPLWRQVVNRPVSGGYDLRDMAADIVGLLDHLGVQRAHLVGMSMGGMIAQTMAAEWPERAASLTSIFSSTGARGVGGISPRAMLRLALPTPRTEAVAQSRHVAQMRTIASRQFPFDEEAERGVAARAWQRGGGRVSYTAMARQVDAIARSGDRSEALRRIAAPTLVVHGDTDLMVHPSGGHATADLVPGARLVTIHGMRHHLAPGLTDRLVRLITDHARGRAGPRVRVSPGRRGRRG